MAPGNLINPDGSPLGSSDDANESTSPGQASGGPGAESGGDESLQTDESWKEAAAKEKEKLDEEARQQEPRELPQASFMTMMSDFGFQAMMALGLIGPEGQTQRMVDLQAAKFVIDTLGVLEEKTKGNLTEEEEKTLAELVQTLRMRFVEIGKLVAAQQAQQAQAATEQGQAGPGGDAPPGGPAPGGGIIME